MLTSTNLRQPTTLLGLALSFAAIALAFFGKIDIATASVLASAGVGLICVNDNTDKAALEQLVNDGVAVAVNRNLTDKLPALLNDAMAVAKKAGVVVFLVAFCLMGAVACTPAQQVVACKWDGGLQPIATATLRALVPATDGALTTDQLLIHPVVVAYCASLGGAPATTAAPPAAPSASLPPGPVPASALAAGGR